MSNLTIEEILKQMHALPAPRHDDLFSFPPRRFMGMNLVEAPPAPQKITVRDIKFADGTSILPAAFRANMNAWLLDRFGRQEDMFKDKIYILGGMTLVASPLNAAMIRNCM